MPPSEPQLSETGQDIAAEPISGRSRPSAPALRLAREILPVVPAAALVTFWALSASFSGAYFPSAWYPAAIIVVVICPLMLAAGFRLPVGGGALALGLLFALVAWTALSILWADAQGHALEATNELLLALASAFVFALTPWTERRAVVLMGLFSIAFLIASLVTVLSAAFGGFPAGSFEEGRFSEPLGYAGASAAFAAMAVWPALALSARRNGSSWLRGVFFAVAVVQTDLAFLPQARGAAVGLAISALFFLFYVRPRAWALARILAAAAVVALSVDPILRVYSAANEAGDIKTSLESALLALALAAAASVVLGLVFVVAERRSPDFPGAAAASRRRTPALIGAAAIVLVLIAVFGGRASNSISERWDEFKAGRVTESGSHLGEIGDPERYDYWRVAVKVTGENPVGGVGAGNYQDVYTVDRHEEKHSKYAHDIWLRFSSETGLIGIALLIAFLVIAYFTVWRRRLSVSPAVATLSAGLLATTAYFMVHASFDWIDQFPALLGPGIAFLFVATRLSDPPPARRQRHHAATVLTGVVLAGLALVALIPAYLSVRFIDQAEGEWPTDPARAYSDLNRAGYLNPLSSQPDLVEGQIAVARGEEKRARLALESAVSREDNWYPHFLLAGLASQSGEKRRAIAQMVHAKELDPLDEGVIVSLRRLRRGRQLEAASALSGLEAESSERFFHLHPEESKR